MPFITDKQTLTDLNIHGKFKAGSMFNLFNRVETRGGEKLMGKMFRSPLSHAGEINRRAARMKYIQTINIKLDINAELTEMADQYLSEGKSVNRFTAILSCYKKKLQETLYHSELFAIQQKKIKAIQSILNTGHNLLKQLKRKTDSKESDNPIKSLSEELNKIINNTELTQLSGKYPYAINQTARYQYIIQNKCFKELEALLSILYKFDIYISVASVAKQKQLTYAEAVEQEETDILLKVENLKHPALNNAVGNDLTLDKSRNLLFLTGANMAGKSTWMKTLGISFYLAHMGFPIAGDHMSFIVMEGIYTSINVSDNINKGWSHFYAEVMRMKQVARELSQGHRVFVLFDEMYKSTNVKDAYDATLAITQRLAKYNSCHFVISTHIIEVGEKLRDNPSIIFRYLPTFMKDNRPHYTYNLTEGITTDRQGMIIIENEKILEMLE